MGRMVDGIWRLDEEIAAKADGSWQRTESQLRHWITPDGGAGPTGEGDFPAEAGRYHLFAAWNCPWAHRALLMHALKGLGNLIDISFVAPRRTDQGWVFEEQAEYRDNLFGVSSLHEIYHRSTPDYSGRVTVPVLYDKKRDCIVSNESADIVRMFGSAFDQLGATLGDFYPKSLREDIDHWNARIHQKLNNGVYRAGFASSQRAYDQAVTEVFEMLAAIEERLSETDYLAGDQITEADIRLLPTLFRFDVAYWSAFKCNKRRLIDYPNLWHYARRFYAMSEIAETVKFDVYRRGYHSVSEKRNPHGIVPLGPVVDWQLLANLEKEPVIS